MFEKERVLCCPFDFQAIFSEEIRPLQVHSASSPDLYHRGLQAITAKGPRVKNEPPLSPHTHIPPAHFAPSELGPTNQPVCLCWDAALSQVCCMSASLC